MIRNLLLCLVFATPSLRSGADELPLQPSREDKPYNSITFLTFSDDGARLATSEYGGPVRIWDAETCKLLHKLDIDDRGDREHFDGVAFSPDGKMVASLLRGRGPNRELALWEVESGELSHTVGPFVHRGTSGVSDLKYAPEGDWIWVCEFENVTRVNATTGSSVTKSVDGVLHGRLRFVGNGDALVVGGMAQFNVHDPKTGRRQFQYRSKTLKWGEVTPKGDRFYALTRRTPEVLLGEIDGGRVIKRARPETGAPGHAAGLPSGNEFVLLTTGGYLERWNLDDLSCTGRVPRPFAAGNYGYNATLKYGKPDGSAFFAWHPTPLVVSPDGTRVAVVAGRQFALLDLDWKTPPDATAADF